MSKIENYVGPYDHFYRVTDQDGTTRFETVNRVEAEEFLKKKFEETGNLFNMEQVLR